MKKIDFKSLGWKKLTKFVILAIALLLFSVWVNSIWVFIIISPLLFDGYFTKFINWRWWQSHPNSSLRYAMKWVEDIVVVLVLVHMLNLFVFQQFKIPSSSLEKTCLVGDHLYVSKLSYGPRVPMTPFAFPLVHNMFPWGMKSYLDKPQLEYNRAKGLGSVERGDIVVFNFPAGDTVALQVPNPDYYTLVHQFGREHVHRNRQRFGEIVHRPVDMRDHYVKRCVGMPGDSLEIKNNVLFINGQRSEDPEHLQYNYFIQTDGSFFSESELDDLGVSVDDRMVLDGREPAYAELFASMSLDTIAPNSFGTVYHFPLTREMKEKLEKRTGVRKVVVEPTPTAQDFPTYPLTVDKGWTRDNYGPIFIPKKGVTIHLNLENLPIYERCIRNFEGHTLSIKEGRIFIDGAATDTYTFAMDYYFMMGDNRHNSADSRAWGFVPEDHIVGKPLFVWLSIDKDKPLFGGGIRWSRFFSVPK
ncbi:signal peptidase I [Porphyromonas sp.]|uniref:signal peptidase I n=1 Tax=Porphyromonas sp. TaxID=1924944 RepID=UPI0026DB8122|nr:signal peptidase I [Porphyromonas sp.]MDO4770810.1 signal peptidase I [Porphyromonas sp.]